MTDFPIKPLVGLRSSGSGPLGKNEKPDGKELRFSLGGASSRTRQLLACLGNGKFAIPTEVTGAGVKFGVPQGQNAMTCALLDHLHGARETATA